MKYLSLLNIPKKFHNRVSKSRPMPRSGGKIPEYRGEYKNEEIWFFKNRDLILIKTKTMGTFEFRAQKGGWVTTYPSHALNYQPRRPIKAITEALS